MFKLLADYVLLILSIITSIWLFYKWYEVGFKISAGGNIGQLEGGLIPLFLIISIVAIFYFLFEIDLNKKK